MSSDELMLGWVCRLVPTSGKFPPDSKTPRLTDFVPTSEDRDHAKATGGDPLVSVYDEQRTTLEQAKALFKRSPSVGFGLNVERLRTIGVPGTECTLRVLRDPLEGPEAEMPGAEGHCGIWGLKRQRGVPRKDYKRLCLRICDLAVPREAAAANGAEMVLTAVPE